MSREKLQDAGSAHDPFRLAGLPQLEPATDAWPQIEEALRRQKTMPRTWTWLAASAAALALATGLYWQLPGAQPVDGLVLPVAGETQGTGATDSTAQSSNNLEALVSLSQRLERNLRAMRTETGVIPAQSLVYQVELEDLVSQVDEAINLNPDSRELWTQRVNLLLDLNQLQRQQLRREYSQVASL